jgi:hypothetical protein
VISGRRSSHDEALIVQCDATIQPAGVRVCADEQEEVTQGTGVGSSGPSLAKHRCGEARDLIPFKSDYLGPGVQLHIGQRGDAIEQDGVALLEILRGKGH